MSESGYHYDTADDAELVDFLASEGFTLDDWNGALRYQLWLIGREPTPGEVTTSIRRCHAKMVRAAKLIQSKADK